MQETKTSLTEKMKKIAEQKAKLQNQINEENSKNTTTAGRLILQLSVALAGKYDFTISYIAYNAFWTPYYDVRVDDIKSPIKLVAKAKISQTTGIDWKQVKLSLSTSTPSQWGAAPVLNAWYLAYINPVYAMNRSLGMNSIQPMAADANKDFMTQPYLMGEYVDQEKHKLNIKGAGSAANNEPLYIVNGSPMSKEEFAKISPSAIQK